MLVVTRLAKFDGVGQRRKPLWIEDDVPSLGHMLGLGQALQGRAGQRVDEANVGITHDEAARGAHGHRGLHGERERGALGRLHGYEALHGLLHGQRGRDGAQAVIVVEPTGDGVARKGDRTAAPTVQLTDQGIVDVVQVARQFLGAALRTQLAQQRLGQRGEARDIRKERGALRAVRQRGAVCERLAPIHGDVGDWMFLHGQRSSPKSSPQPSRKPARWLPARRCGRPDPPICTQGYTCGCRTSCP